jgi:sugar phosphate isomerase/epimerase
MVPGIFARTYASKDPATVFRRIRADGFSAVQFNLSCAGLDPIPAQLPDGTGAGVLARARAEGLTLAALSGTWNMVHPDPEARRAARRGFANVLAAARDMEVPLVTLCTGSRDAADMWRAHPDNASPAAWTDLRAEMDMALEAAEAMELALAIEPEPGNVVADARLARRFLDEVGSPRLGIILDAANLLPPEALPRQAEVVAEALDLLGGNLMLVHAKDVDARGVVVPAGEGAVDLADFVGRVRATGYDGALVGHGFEEADAPGVARRLSALIADGAR